MISQIMAASIRDIPKRRGRPKTTGRGEGILVRLHAAQVAALDAWIGRQAAAFSRPSAIRHLLDQALVISSAPTGKDTPLRVERRAQARKLAGEAIDRSLQHSGQPEEVKAERKKRLTKGPPEFRKR